MRNAECGMRNISGRRRGRRRLWGIEPGHSITQSAFHTPHSGWGRAAVMGYPHKPHPKETAVLSRYFGAPDARTHNGRVQRRGHDASTQAQTMAPAAINETV